MKKQGFTLAELLIVLGVTGVIAAALLSAVSILTPDKNKIACGMGSLYQKIVGNILAVSLHQQLRIILDVILIILTMPRLIGIKS